MTLLARRREDIAREPVPGAATSERRSVVVRPREPQRGFLHVQGALGNHATGVLLRSDTARIARRELPPGAPHRSLARGGLTSSEAVPLLRVADSLRLTAVESAVPPSAAARVIVADGAPLRPDQMGRSRFLTAMREAAREAAEEGLSGTGHTARACPWIEHYFRIYERLASERIEADVRRYVPASQTAASAEELLAHATAHVRESVRHWAATGELIGVPRGLPGMTVLEALGGSLAGVGRLVAQARIEGEPAPRRRDVRDPVAVQAELGPGRPLPVTARSRMERAFGRSFAEVRLHNNPRAARLARRLRARAFAVGRHVAFERGAYRPGTLVGDALLAHELAHVAQQSGLAPGAPTPAARSLDRDADGAAAGAVARLWQRGRALPGLARPARPQLRAGLSLQRCSSTPDSDKWFVPYRERFNRLWSQEPYGSMDTAFDATLTSKGPRTARSREIFERLYVEDAELREAYDQDKGGLRERIDTYVGPEGLNLINSPRLRALEQVFARFEPPVAGGKFQEFKRAVAAAAGALDDEDRQAFNLSNEWDLQLNRYLRGADQRREIRLLINPPVAPSEAPAPEETPEDQLTQEQKVRRFFDRWQAFLLFKRGLTEPFFSTGADVRYEDRRQLFRVHSSSSIANPGQVLFVRVRVSRGATVIASPDPAAFPAGQKRMPPIVVPIEAPATIPAEGDPLVFDVELLEGDLTTVRGVPRRFEMKVKEQTALTRAAAEVIAGEDDRYLNDPTPPGLIERMRDRGGIFGKAAEALGGVVHERPSGLLGKMSARGGIPANVSEAIRGGRLTLRALTERHDSGAFVEAKLHRPDPSKVGYFAGPTYGPGDSKSFVEVPADAFRLPDFGPRFIVVNRTPDLRNPARKRSDDGMIEMLVHEAVHALDVRPGDNAPLERYKTEFRAYWMDAHLGPPLEGSCPEDQKAKRCTDLGGSCLDTSYCAELPPPGPKTPRSRSIFNHLYGSPTYDFVKTSYDGNVDGFRRAVDQYVVPDGIDLIVSIRLDDLRILVDGWNGRGFPDFRSRLRAYFRPEGDAPPHGRLSEEEKVQVRGDRAWRNLVERKVEYAAQQRIIKHDLGIPT